MLLRHDSDYMFGAFDFAEGHLNSDIGKKPSHHRCYRHTISFGFLNNYTKTLQKFSRSKSFWNILFLSIPLAIICCNVPGASISDPLGIIHTMSQKNLDRNCKSEGLPQITLKGFFVNISNFPIIFDKNRYHMSSIMTTFKLIKFLPFFWKRFGFE